MQNPVLSGFILSKTNKANFDKNNFMVINIVLI